MKYLLSAIFAIVVVTAQYLWKRAVTNTGFNLDPAFMLSRKMFNLTMNFYFLGGLALYVLGIVLYLGLLSKYHYSTVQFISIPLTLIFSIGVARLLLHESISAINMAGVVLLLAGIMLASSRA